MRSTHADILLTIHPDSHGVNNNMYVQCVAVHPCLPHRPMLVGLAPAVTMLPLELPAREVVLPATLAR